MRLRNVKNAKEILRESNYFMEDATSNKGVWANIFGNNNPIMLEIGMGKGDFLIGMAKSHPEWNFIGVEKYESVLVRAVEKLDNLELNNVKTICTDAKELVNIFNNEIDTIYLNFSDPWPKKKHHKRRLTDRSFLAIYDSIFLSNAKIIMKTDNDALFEGSLVSLTNYGYVLDEVVLDLWKTDKENIRTEYENKFGSQGYKIKYLVAHKKVEENDNI